MHSFLPAACTSFALLALVPSIPAQVPAAPAAPTGSVHLRAWEHETSDIPVDPRIHFGALPSGLRYAWMENGEPEQRVYLRLHVDVGSFAESDSEVGMAHFLEHMAFNGSKHFPPGTLVEWLQKHGLGFGGDTNAMTDFSQTVYQLDLPTNDEVMLSDGLRVMRDVVDGLLLQDTEINAEKGVIDGEERERESAQFRAMRHAMEVLFAGTRVPQRMPIGTKAARDAFDSKAMRAFWERWYRPDQCTLLLVGDLRGRDPVPAITAAFGDLALPTTPRPVQPPIGTPKLAQRAFAVFDREIPSVTFHVQLLRPHVEQPDTKATRIADLALDYARAMVNLRFSELLRNAGTPFLGAQLGEGGGMEVWDGETLLVACVPDRWQAALMTAQAELRRALQHGFTAAELDEVRADSLLALDEALKQEATQDSDAFIEELLACCEVHGVPTDAATEKTLFDAPTRALTVEACHRALTKAWSDGQLVVSAVGGLDLGADAEKTLLAAWEAGQKAEVVAAAKVEAGAFAYGSDPEKAGSVAARATDAEFSFEDVTFANGVRLLLKKTDFEERQIVLRVLVGEGTLSLDPTDTPLRLFAQQTFLGGGLGRHSSDDLRRLTAGKQVGVQFGALEDAFVLVGATAAEDLQMECELACAYLTDPGLREEGATQFRRALAQIYEQQKHAHGGPIAMQFMPRLYGDDPRVQFPPLEVEQAITMEQIGSWLRGAFATAPITIVLAGDFDVEAGIAAIARTFGALPQRRARIAFDERRVFPPMTAGLKEAYSIDTNVQKALVLVQWATTDGRVAATRRALNYLADVVNDRLRLEIREKLGASYSPRASQSASMVYPGNGNLAMQAMTEPGEAARLADALLAVATKLVDGGVTDDEVDRLRPEILARLRDQQRMNPFWADVLGGFHTGRKVQEELRTLVSTSETMTATTLSALAKQYLKPELASIAIVQPKGAADGAAGKGASGGSGGE
ncbi:MAG: insulinase family protein [Planctomycetes bacterium]|nr:insulinase family protein [Planctomycetota bacterium]